MEIEKILTRWYEENPNKIITRSCPNIETNNSIFIYYKELEESTEEKQMEISVSKTTLKEDIKNVKE